MKKTFALLTASAALAAVIGLPAWSAMNDRKTGDGILSGLFGDDHRSPRVWFVDDDDDDHGRNRYRKYHDDDDDDDDDGYGMRGRQPNPAPAGTVVPPKNGLFGDGAAPQVKVN